MSARPPVDDGDVRAFRDVVRRRLGLSLRGSAVDLEEVLRRRVAASGLPCADYLMMLDGAFWSGEAAALTETLTVPETYFFRNAEQFRALAEAVLPERLAAGAGRRSLRVLSAGCATGEEAYTVAIVLDGLVPAGWTVEILGVDVNPAALRRARDGRFSTWSLRATPADVRDRWFVPAGDGVRLVDAARRWVRFAPHNLLEDDPALLPPDRYDVIFCRNVLMYLTPEAGAAVMARLSRSLAPEGVVFLGHAETGFGRAAGLHVRQSHDTFYHRRPATPPAAGTRAGPAPADPATGSGGTAPPPAWPAGGVPVPPLGDGRLDRAEEDCRRRLEVDPLDPGVHYLLALCCEDRGDESAAHGHYRMAAYLDPTFAVVHLRLGLMARRRGDVATARQELERARALLSREDPDRLRMFGGGFSRRALADLCQAQLRACGAAP